MDFEVYRPDIFREFKQCKPNEASGIRLLYARMPKAGFGFNFGGSVQQVNEHSSDNKTPYIYKGEGNATISTRVGANSALYGFGGLHLLHLTDVDIAQQIGVGAQLGGGFAFSSHFSMELGYVTSRVGLKDNAFGEGATIDTAESYFTLTGLTTRGTYNF